MLRIVKKRERIDADVLRRLCLHVRSVHQYTQSELATASGVKLSVIQRIEQGVQRTFPYAVHDAFARLV